MDRRELAYAKQTIPAVKDWDDYQTVIRTWARLLRPRTGRNPIAGMKKT